ncbi:unnamed protein product [Prorocentrum cordatum]|uniref:Solute-binding protein family 5 domain-containing protein n=1 Tax=Prorocentrum cordatum TaxID=2364126 RepID=A0ABN9PFA8_9DINO|nr:unnamed protein product [Polarella glacialis]
MASSLDPTDGSTPWSLVSHGIAEKLFTVDKMGQVVPQMAETVTRIDTYTWTVTLAGGKTFSDGQAVLAEHVVTALTTQNAENPNGNDALGEMTVTKVNDSTIQIVSTIAHPAMDAALANWVFGGWRIFLKSGDNYIYSGPYMVESMTPGDTIQLAPNAYYTDGPTLPVTIKKYSSGDALADALKAKQVDMAFHLPIDSLAEVDAVEGVTTKSFDVGYLYMMFHNTRSTSPLSDLNVRQAVDLIIDRKALRQALQGGDETRSLFLEDTPYLKPDASGTLQEDQSAAEDLLTNAGWLLENGKRMKNGIELSLTLYSYPFRPDLGTMRPLIQASLESLGITVNGGDVCLWEDAYAAILADNDYDLLMWAQHTLPNGDPQWFLNAFFRGDPMDSRNYAGINSSTVDSLLDALALAGHANNERVNAAMAVHTEILDEVAVSSLVFPEWHVGLSERLAAYDPWGSDYYVIRSDFEASFASTPAPTANPTPAPTRAPTPAPTPAAATTPDPLEGGEVGGAGREALLGGLAAACLVPLAAA